MNVLVTGALGHIGSKLIRHLAEHHAHARIAMVDNFSTQRYCSLFNLPDRATYSFLEAELTEADIDELIRAADVVIHLAGNTDAAGSYKNPERFNQNRKGTRKVAEACARLKRPMLFSSSTSVYGTQNEVVDEDCTEAELKPQSPYAEAKIDEEKCLQELGARSGLRFTICRFGTICGVSPGMRFHTAINKFCWQAVMGQPITVWKTALHQRRPYLALPDACAAVSHIVSSELFDNGVYNVLTENLTVDEILTMVRSHVPDLKVEFVDSPIMNQLSYTVANKKLAEAGFEPRESIERHVHETIECLRNANTRGKGR